MKASFGADHFNKVAATYEYRDVSRATKVVRDLIALAPPISQTSIVLDNASGPGIIAAEILKQSISADITPQIYAADISPAMIEMLRQKNLPRVKSDVMDAQELSYSDNTFTHSFMNMGIFLLPNPERGAAEIYRTLKPGGVAIITSVKQAGWVRIFQAAQREVKPDFPLWKGLLKEEWSTEQKIRDVILAGGFQPENIDVTTAESSHSSNLINDFLASVKDKVTLAITEDWSKVEKQQFEDAYKKELENQHLNPQELEMITWVVRARK